MVLGVSGELVPRMSQSQQALEEEGEIKIMVVSDHLCQWVNLLVRRCCANGFVEHWPDMYHAGWVQSSQMTLLQCIKNLETKGNMSLVFLLSPSPHLSIAGLSQCC